MARRVLRAYEELVLACAVTGGGEKSTSACGEQDLASAATGGGEKSISAYEELVLTCAATGGGERVPVSAYEEAARRVLVRVESKISHVPPRAAARRALVHMKS